MAKKIGVTYEAEKPKKEANKKAEKPKKEANK